MSKAARQQRSARYSDKFWGVNQVALESFRAKIPRAKDRAAAFDLLVRMLLGSEWDFHKPEADFKISIRQIRGLTTGSKRTIDKHILSLIEARILKPKRARTGNSYYIDCGAVGMVRSMDRSKKKAKKPYKGKFFGLTNVLMENLKSKFPPRKGARICDRSGCLWVLVNMMVYSPWKVSEADKPFQISLSELMFHTGMAINTVRKYVNMLIEAEFLGLYLPGGRGRTASYALNTDLAGINVRAKNPTERRELGSYTDIASTNKTDPIRATIGEVIFMPINR